MSELRNVRTRCSGCFRAPKCNLCGEGHTSDACSFNSQGDSQRIYKRHNCKANNLPHNHKANNTVKYIEIKSVKNRRKNPTTTKSAQNFAASAPQFIPAPLPPPLTRSFANVATQRTNSQIDLTYFRVQWKYVRSIVQRSVQAFHQ